MPLFGVSRTYVDAHPAWRVPALEAGIDLAECHFRRHDRRALSLRPRSSSGSTCGGAAAMCAMFRSVFWALAIFVAICGVTRLLSILTLWVPAYGIEGCDQRRPGADLGRDHGRRCCWLLPRLLVLPTRIQLQQAYAALAEETRQRRKRRGHGAAFSGDRGHRVPGPAGAEDGSHRPAHRRRRARLQQHPDRDHRHHRNPRRRGQGPPASGPDHQSDQRRGGARRRPHPASAGLRPPSAAAAAQHRRQRPGHRCGAAAAADARRADRNRIDAVAGFRAGADRSQPALDRDPQPRLECAGRHARAAAS